MHTLKAGAHAHTRASDSIQVKFTFSYMQKMHGMYDTLTLNFDSYPQKDDLANRQSRLICCQKYTRPNFVISRKCIFS